MKMELELKTEHIGLAIIILGIGIILGMAIAIETTPTNQETTTCLTNQDLNRQDIATGIILSRHCEGIGLQSSVYWQQDQNGNVYALPICVQTQVAQ